jgi:hypothetical protein
MRKALGLKMSRQFSVGRRSILAVAGTFCMLTTTVATAEQQSSVAPYDLDEAINRGVVDLYFNPWTKRSITPLVEHLGDLNVGLINRLGFQYGGQSMQRLKSIGDAVSAIRKISARSLIGGGFNEAIYKNYKQSLTCGGSLGTQTFTAAELASHTELGSNAVLVDMGQRRVQDYCICIGQIQIDEGISYLHFEAPSLVLRASSSRSDAVEGYKRVQQTLRAYGKAKGMTIYFSGDSELAKVVKLDGAYFPSRFYHTTIPKFLRYQNRVPQPGIGVGYTYALSNTIIEDTVADTPKGTRIFFYVDNWDENQDDLRRFMELDAQNRRKLMELSARAAAKGSVYFIPPLALCEGCVKPAHVGDSCEILPGGDSEYDAFACGDFPAIQRALQLEAPRVH